MILFNDHPEEEGVMVVRCFILQMGIERGELPWVMFGLSPRLNQIHLSRPR